MLSNNPPIPVRPDGISGPSDLMIGTCQTCRMLVECAFKDTRASGSEFLDYPKFGCPRCGAVVFMQRKTEKPNGT